MHPLKIAAGFAALSLLATCTRADQPLSGPASPVLADIEGDILWTGLPVNELVLSDDTLTITEGGTYILTGQSTAGIVVRSDDNIRLVLNGVSVVNRNGAAINVENADNTVIHLADGSENYLEDSVSRRDPGIDGAIFSSDDLLFSGSGKLSVKANFKDGIVSKDDLVISSGTYVVRSADDGIRGKDSLLIEGGSISVTAADDGIKSTNDSDLQKGYVRITGGSIKIDAVDDAIKAVTSIIVDGGSIETSRSLEGMEATNITINDGDIVVVARDDGINAVRDGLGGDVFITVNGGNIEVTVGYGDTDAFDSNGSLLIAGGNITVTAPTSSFDYEWSGEMTGGTIVVNGQTMTSLPASRWGGRGRGMRDFGRPPPDMRDPRRPGGN